MGLLSCLIFSIVFIGLKNSLACPPRMNCALRLTCGARPSIQSLYNIEKQMGVVIDTDNDLSLLFDGNTGMQILYDIEKSMGVRISASFNVSKSNIADYVESISSLTEIPIYDEAYYETKTFQIKTAPDYIVSAHRNIIETLEPEISDFAEYKKTDILSISLNLFGELCKIRKQRLQNIFDMKFNFKNSFVYGGLVNVVSVFRGLSRMLEETQGAIERLILKPNFDFQPIFMAECGSESLALVLDQLQQSEVSSLYSLKYPSVLYNIVREFNGGLYRGLRGIETLVYHLVQFSLNRVSLEVLIDIIIQVISSIKNATYSLIIEKIKLIQRVANAKASPKISSIISYYCNAFLEDKLVINNVNINEIVKEHLVGTSFGLANVISILHKMSTNFYASLSLLLKRMSFFVMTGQAPFYVMRLIPSLKESLDLSIGVPPLFQISELLNPNIFEKFNENFFENTISSIPVIGTIFKEISRILPMVHASLASWVSEMTKFDSYGSIFGWLKFGMGMKGGIQPTGCVHEMGLWGLDRRGCTCWD